MALFNTAVLIMNVGTPESPSVKEVRRYLFRFLNDHRVIDIPRVFQKILVNLIIVPFRARGSARLYKLLWSEKGSPLLVYGNSVKEKLQDLLGDDYKVFLGMRYGNPYLKKVLEEIRTGGYTKVIVLPLFPQYASSTGGTAQASVMASVRHWNIIPEIHFMGQFYDHPGFIDAFVKRIREYHPENYDHLIFSYHGLPQRHILKVHPGIGCENCACIVRIPEYGKYCYKATCYETTRQLAAKLKLKTGSFSMGFQSRLTKKWLEPFTDEIIVTKAREGVKNILVIAPAFVADCLETTVEIGIGYKNLFLHSGGERLDCVESLNDMPEWITALKNMIIYTLPK
jgi:protoporphyrin/coproporphyrin ferrochelatase